MTAYKALKQNSTIRKTSCYNKQPLQKKKQRKRTKKQIQKQTNKQNKKNVAKFFRYSKNDFVKFIIVRLEL